MRALVAPLLALLPALAAGAPALHEPAGDTPDEVRRALREALVEEAPLLGETALAPRPAADALARLRELAVRFPDAPAVQRQLAETARAAGDAATAEAALTRAVELGRGAAPVLEELAAFYEARGEVDKQVQTLERLAAELVAQARRPGGSERRAELKRTYERILAALAVRRVQDPDRVRRALVDLDPEDGYALRRYVDELVRQKDLAGLKRAVALYQSRRPQESVALARALATELEGRRDVDGALAIYARLLAREPVPADARRLYGDYLDLLDRTLKLRPRRRALELRAKGEALRGAELATLVFMQLRDGQGERARALLDRLRREDRAATPLELRGRARLAAAADAPELATTLLYAAARSAKGGLREETLAELARALLGSSTRSALTPRAPLASFDLTKLDSGPSLLGGLASLLFIGPRSSGAELARAETALGNGQRALGVLAELRRIAPRSRATQELLARAVQFHRAYKLPREAAALADDFLRSFPNGRDYFEVGLAGAAAHEEARDPAAANRQYRRLLDTAQRRAADAAYRRVLDAWTGALVERRQDLAAVKLYAAEVKRRPADRALLERFLAFVEQRNLYDDELRLYREAAHRFGGAGFWARIARFYLRHERVKDFRELNDSLVKSLGDAELVAYLQQAGGLTPSGAPDGRAAFLRQRELVLRGLYEQALARFPLEAAFVRRLLESYDRSTAPADARARGRLATRYAVLDPTLADEFVRFRAAHGRLDDDLAHVRAGRNPAERILRARITAFRSRFEEALPAARAVLTDYPADRESVRAVAALEASLGRPSRAAAARAAVATLDAALAVSPADEALTTWAGDLLAEAGLIEEARARYEQIVALRPADLRAYLRLATVYWDYYVFDRAAGAIERARRATRDPELYAEKLAAIYESAHDRDKALREYVRISWARLDRGLGWVAQARAAGVGVPEDGAREEGEGEGEGGGGEAAEGPAPVEAVRQKTPAAEQVAPRLVYLAHTHGLGARIDAAYAAAIKGAHGDPRPAVAYATYLVAAERRPAALTVWLTAVAGAQDRALLERAVTEGAGFGVPGSALVIAARRRLATLADGAPEQVQALAAALEAAGQPDAAAAALTELAARLRGGAALAPAEIAEAENRLADLFGRVRRTPEALAARRRAADVLPPAAPGQAGPREAVLLRLAAELGAAGQVDAAVALYRELAAQTPADARPLVALAEMRWTRGERDAAVRDLRDAITAARALAPAARGPVTAALREALLARLAELGQARGVVDQYVELINRDPTRRDLVDAAFTYARTHGGLDGLLLDFYQAAATRAPKDHRYPVIVAWLHERRGQPAEAARAYGRALAIAPGRKDLTRAQAAAHAAAAQWSEAAVVYRTLYELEDHDRGILVKVAEMDARAGRLDEARRAVQEMVRGSDRPADYMDAALALERMGLVADAYGYAESALGVLLGYPAGRAFQAGWAADYARLAARTGAAGPAYARLKAAAAALRRDGARAGNVRGWQVRSLAAIVEQGAETALARAVAEVGGPQNARGLAQALAAAAAEGPAARDGAARFAERAGLPTLARELWSGGGGDARAEVVRWQQLWTLVTARGDVTETLALLARAPKLTPVERAARAARAHRELGDEAAELGALQRYFEATVADCAQHGRGPFDVTSALVERYLELLMRRHAECELGRLARTRSCASAQIAGFLLARGARPLALAAIAAAGQGEPPVWLDVKRATALAELGDTGAEVRVPLARALDLRPVGARTAARPDLARVIVGARAYALTRRLGTIVGRADGAAAAARLLAAAVEERPRDPAAYAEVGDRLLELGGAALAEEAFARALVLAPRDHDLLDRRARAVLARGERARALAAWREILAGPRPSLADHVFHAQALARAGLTAEARAALAPTLATLGPQLTDSAFIDALRELAALYPSRAAGSEWERTLRGLVLGGERLPVIAAAAGLIGGRADALLERSARGPYLARGLALLARSTDAARRWEWRLAELEWLTDSGRAAEVPPRVAAALPEAANAAPAVRLALRLARARAQIRLGGGATLAAALAREARGAGGAALYAPAIRLLTEEKLTRPATELTVEMHRDLVAAGREDRGTLLGLVDALLKLGRKDEAVVHLTRLTVREWDDPESQRLAAELCENHRLFADARGPRLTLLALRADDAENRLMLGRDAVAAGLRDEGLGRLVALVDDATAPRAVRFKAGEALLAAAAGDAAAAARLADRVAGRPADDEPAAVAFAGLRRVGRPTDARARAALERTAGAAPAPAEALAALGEDALGRGDPRAAARLFERAGFEGTVTPRLKRLLFTARRAAGQHDAALLALADRDAQEFLDSLPAPLAAGERLEERGARAAAALGADGGDALGLATAALDSARRAGDEARGLYYALAAAAAASGPARASFAQAAETTRAALRAAAERADRRRLTRGLDEAPADPIARLRPRRGAAPRGTR